MEILGNFKIEVERVYDKQQRTVTAVQVFDMKGRRVARGRTVCSTNDTFCKAKGRKLAMSNAISRSDIPKKERTKIWEDYRTKLTKNPRW